MENDKGECLNAGCRCCGYPVVGSLGVCPYCGSEIEEGADDGRGECVSGVGV